MRNLILSNKIYNYIKDHQSENIDTVDIVKAFPNDHHNRIFESICDLRIEKKVSREEIGIYYRYKIL